jgi:microcystin-dependent protein
MGYLVYSSTLTNGTTADAAAVEAKFAEVADAINGGIGDANMDADDPLAPDKIQTGTGAGQIPLRDEAGKLPGSITGDAATLNGKTAATIMDEAIPTGLISMWSGAIEAIPTGWALCNGQNGTPDLRDRFVVGAGNTYEVGDTGGEAAHTLTIEEMPEHDHKYNKPDNLTVSYIGTSSNNATVNINGTTGKTGGGQPHENRPPYYALAYIIKL